MKIQLKGKNEMIKIAILSHIPVSKGLSGKEKEISNIAKMLNGKGTNVEIFSLSTANRTIKKDSYVEHEIKGSNYASRSKMSRIVDNLCMLAFGTKPMLNKMNENPQILRSLAHFDPDIIICGSFLLSRVLGKYLLTSGRKPKVISVFDSQTSIYNYARAVGNVAGRENKVKAWAASKIARSYIGFNLKLYAATLRLSDVHVVQTNKDRTEVINHFKDRKARVVALPAQFYSAKKTRAKKSTNITNILFVGSYSYPPNREAMDKIERVIAPAMPDKNFIIGGGGCPIKRISNVNYVGTIQNISKAVNAADLCIAPLSNGSGIKFKMLDYFGASKAVVGTSVAFDGYNVRNGYNAIVEDEIEKYPDAIRALEADAQKFALIQRNSAKLTEDFKFDVLSAKWRRLVEDLSKQRG